MDQQEQAVLLPKFPVDESHDEGAAHDHNICHYIKYLTMQVRINPQRPSVSCHGNKEEKDYKRHV